MSLEWLRSEGKGHNVLESVTLCGETGWRTIKIGYPHDFEGHRGNRASGDRTQGSPVLIEECKSNSRTRPA
jgi:hypothetical protein